MSVTDVYAPCPCGSGKKYKFCCKLLHAASHVPILTTGSRGYPDRPDASAHLGKLSSGTEDELTQYAQPMLSKTGEDPANRRTVMDLALVCWNLAMLDLAPEHEHAEVLKLADNSANKNPEIRKSFIALVKSMLDRHREMYPEKHGARTRAMGDEGKLFDLDGRRN